MVASIKTAKVNLGESFAATEYHDDMHHAISCDQN